uniref:Protein kinase domain-containing protein n=1 Tax=Ditylenchus dipsaci TaxID=166011 RepID=A0A915DXI4_9BILA
MWSLGCILGEMLLGRALFPGSSTINQIERIMNTINKPSKSDVDSIGSHYATSVLEKMPQRPKKPLDTLLANSSAQAMDLVNRLLVFAPHKRLNVEQCLIHPYVFQFHNPMEEPALSYDVTLSLPDHIQLTVDEYRDQLYDMITSKKTHIRRIQHDKLITGHKPTLNNNFQETPEKRPHPPTSSHQSRASSSENVHPHQQRPNSQPHSQYYPPSSYPSMVSLPASSSMATGLGAHSQLRQQHQSNGRFNSSSTVNNNRVDERTWQGKGSTPPNGHGPHPALTHSMVRTASVTDNLNSGIGGQPSGSSAGSSSNDYDHQTGAVNQQQQHQRRQWRNFNSAAAAVATAHNGYVGGKAQMDGTPHNHHRYHQKGKSNVNNSIERDDNYRKNGLNSNGYAKTIKSSSSNHHLNSHQEKAAPIAQAECSDTDFDTSRRSPHGSSPKQQTNYNKTSNSVDKNHQHNYYPQQHRTDRAQSADTESRRRKSLTKNTHQTNTEGKSNGNQPVSTSSSKKAEQNALRRRSNENRLGFFLQF